MTNTVKLSDDELIELTRNGLEETFKTDVTSIEPRPFSLRQSSAIVGLLVRFANGEQKQVWAKTLHPGGPRDLKENRTIRDFDLHRFLYGKLGVDGSFRVAHAVYHSPEHRLIVTEHVPGTTLQRLVRSGGRTWHFGRNIAPLTEDCRRVGAWLRAFQSATRDYFPGKDYGHPAPKLKDAMFILEQARSRLDQLAGESTHHFSPTVLCDIRNFLAHRASTRDFSAVSPSCIHGDFFADNIFVHPHCITGLDFTSATWGIPEFDPAYFVYQFETLTNNPSYPKGLIAKLEQSFLAGYLAEKYVSNYWQLNSTTQLLFITLSVSRMLALSKLSRSDSIRRFVARRQSTQLQERLVSHLEQCAINQGCV